MKEDLQLSENSFKSVIFALRWRHWAVFSACTLLIHFPRDSIMSLNYRRGSNKRRVRELAPTFWYDRPIILEVLMAFHATSARYRDGSTRWSCGCSGS